MGILDRFRRRRTEATAKIIWGETSSSSTIAAPPNFVPDLVRNKVTNYNDNGHLDDVAKYDPLANYIVYKLAENAIDDWFTFRDADGNEIMLDVQKELKLLDAKKHFTQVLAAERTFGNSWLYCGKNRYIPEGREGGRVASLMRFTPLDCVVFAYDEVGNPIEYEITVNVGKSQYTSYETKIKVSAIDMINVCSRPIGRGYEGRSVLHSVWDMLTYLRYIYHSMTFYDMKIGHGLFTATTKAGIPDDLVANMETAFEDVSAKRSLVIDGEQIEKVEFIGPNANATSFESHIDACLKLVAAGSGVPKDILIGASAGMISGSETNVKSLFAVINQIQTSFEVTIRELIKKMGFSYSDYDIDWNVRYAHDEEEQSKIAMNNAQTLAIRSSWLTINEIREVEGLPPIEGGDQMKAEFNINVAGMQTADEQEQDRNDYGEN